MSYRLADQTKVANDLSNLMYGAALLLRTAANGEFDGSHKAAALKAAESLIGASAGAHTHKPPAAVLATLQWVQQMAQERATDSDFQTAREALDEHDALRFVTDWLEAQGVDVLNIRAAELRREAREEYQAEAAREQEALDALEAAATAPAKSQNARAAEWLSRALFGELPTSLDKAEREELQDLISDLESAHD